MEPFDYFNMVAGLVQKWLDMARLWDFGRLLVGSSFESLRRRLEASNAFQDDDSAILRF